MKPRLIFLCGLIALSFLTYSFIFEDKNSANDSFVIVELFTSQGCSSCPRADKVLEEIGEVYKNKNVIPLGFHVDYWDRLGWKDTFSQHKFSERQYKYSQRFRNSSVYTPQMIVNGTAEFNGGDKSKAFSLINKKLSKKGTVKINGKLNEQDKQLSINYNLSDIKFHLYDLNVVLVKNKQKVNIKRGENSNREILYNNIVIDFNRLSKTEKSGKLQINKPKDYKKENYTVVLFLQQKKHGDIVGAAKLIHS